MPAIPVIECMVNYVDCVSLRKSLFRRNRRSSLIFSMAKDDKSASDTYVQCVWVQSVIKLLPTSFSRIPSTVMRRYHIHRILNNCRCHFPVVWPTIPSRLFDRTCGVTCSNTLDHCAKCYLLPAPKTFRPSRGLAAARQICSR